jgi:hypothetical protein
VIGFNKTAMDLPPVTFAVFLIIFVKRRCLGGISVIPLLPLRR